LNRGISYRAIISGLGLLVTTKNKKMTIFSYIFKTYVRLFARISGAKLFFMNDEDSKFFSLPSRYIIEGTLPGQGVDTIKFFPKSIKNDRKRIGFVARLIVSKGLIEFVKAAKYVKSIKPNVTFVLVGAIENNFDGVSEKMIKSWESKNIVVWEGHVDDINDKYNSFDILCLPSYREGLSQAIIEGMACGLPIITTDVPGCRDLITDGENGFLIPPKEYEELANKIILLLENQSISEKMGIINRKLAIKKYSINSAMKKYDSLL